MKEKDIFRELQRHLDRQPVGFPSDRSGSDLRLLRHHFTEDEARIALGLSYRYETAETIFQRISKHVPSIEQAESLLASMSSKMSIMRRETDGIMHYCLIPLVIGMYEGRVFEMDSNYVKAYDDYAHSMQHGLSFISTEVMQMRTIPVEKSIETKHHVMPYDNIVSLIENSKGPISIIECSCRKRKKILGEPCRQTAREETCMVFGNMAQLILDNRNGRQINKDEALNIIRDGQGEGLVLQTYNMQKPEVICSCCGCCCEVLSIHKMLPNPVNFWTANFHAEIDADKCRGCRLCISRCLVDAVVFNEKKKKVTIRMNRCIGCGNCVQACKFEALRLESNSETEIPPADFISLQEKIMKNKPRSRLGRVIKRTFFGR